MNYGIHILITSLLVQMRFSESVESMIVVVVDSLLRILVLLSLSRINKITTTKKYGRKYFTKTVFRPLDADDVDNNTKDMEESIGEGYIIVIRISMTETNSRRKKLNGYGSRKIISIIKSH